MVAPGREKALQMLDKVGLNTLLEAKRRDRMARIESLQLAGQARGIHRASWYWQVVHDLEFAPMTTNLRQLNELGIEVPHSWMMDTTELANALEEVIQGLAILGIYLLHTGHLSNQELYERLHQDVLQEPVRELIPLPDSCEWIDLCDGGGLHPSDAWWRFHASEEQRSEAIALGQDLPAVEQLKSNRDERLPRPAFMPSERVDCGNIPESAAFKAKR